MIKSIQQFQTEGVNVVSVCYFHSGEIIAIDFFFETENGRDYLKNWLSLPIEKDELRYETLLKLFFGSEKGEEQAIIHIEAFERKIKEELPYLLHAETISN